MAKRRRAEDLTVEVIAEERPMEEISEMIILALWGLPLKEIAKDYLDWRARHEQDYRCARDQPCAE